MVVKGSKPGIYPFDSAVVAPLQMPVSAGVTGRQSDSDTVCTFTKHYSFFRFVWRLLKKSAGDKPGDKVKPWMLIKLIEAMNSPIWHEAQTWFSQRMDHDLSHEAKGWYEPAVALMTLIVYLYSLNLCHDWPQSAAGHSTVGDCLLELSYNNPCEVEMGLSQKVEWSSLREQENDTCTLPCTHTVDSDIVTHALFFFLIPKCHTHRSIK